MRFSASAGTLLASASDDHTVELTNTDPAHASRTVCAKSSGNLTEQQWKHHIPEADYAPPC
jgi:hypothetical protein